MSPSDHETKVTRTPGGETGVISSAAATSSISADGIAALQRFKLLWKDRMPPDLPAFVAASGPVSEDLLAAILRADLHYRWAAGRTLPVEWYFEQFERLAASPELAVDLIYAEYLQAEKHGKPGGPEEYFLRFPQHRETLRDQFELHSAIGDDDRQAAAAVELNEDEETNGDRKLPLQGFPHVPGYQILEEVGRGGIGVVYRAHDPRLNRTVALKLLLSGAHASATQLRRIQVEAEAAARLQHPGIVQIHEIGDHDGRPYLVLEFVNGGNLADRYRGQPQEPRWSAALVEQLARTVEFAHQHGIIHRDLKPANILLETDEIGRMMDASEARAGDLPRTHPPSSSRSSSAKITDFGLAKLSNADAVALWNDATQTGDVIGTPSYMAPEQAAGRVHEIGIRTDVYALGSILYELLTGRPPFVGATPTETMRQVAESEPVHPSRLVRQVPQDLQTICLKCLEKEPNNRFESALALAEDLARFLNDRPIMARRATSLERTWRWCRRNPLTASLLGSIAALVTLVAVVASVSSFRLSEQLADTAKAELAERRAKSETMERLWDSSLAEARAHRTSRRLGQRFAGLEAIARAKALSDSVALTPERRAALRDSAIACLALPDLRRISTWREANRNVQFGSISNGELRRYARQAPNGDVEVCHVGNGDIIARVRAQDAESKLMLSPDGHWLGVLNQRFRAWRIDGPEPRLTLDESAKGWWSISPDSRFAVGSTADGILRICELESGKPIRDLEHAVSSNPIAISPDGNRAALIADRKIRVIDLQTGSITREFASPKESTVETCLLWNPNGQILTAAPYPEGVREWDVRTGTQYPGYAHDGAFLTGIDATGQLFISHSPWDGLTRLWDARCRKPWLSIPGMTLCAMKPTPTGGFRLVAYAEPDRYALWEIAPQRIYSTAAWTADAGNWLQRISVSPNGRLMVICAKDGLSMIDCQSGSVLATLNIGRTLTEFDVDGQLITASLAGLFRWTRRQPDNDELPTIPSESSIIEFVPPEFPQYPDAKPGAMAVSRDGRTIAVAGADEILVWQVDQADKPLRFGPHEDVRSLAFSSDGNRLASGGWGSPGGAKIWDLASGQLIQELPVGLLCAVAFSPDGRFLATSPRGGEIWRTSDWARQAALKSPDTWASGLSFEFSPDGAVLAVATSTGLIRMVDPETGRDFLTLTDPNQHRVRDFVFTADGGRLATISSDEGGAIHVWDLRALAAELDRLGLLWPEDLPETTFGLRNVPSTKSRSNGPLTVTFGRNAWIDRLEQNMEDQEKE